MSTGFSLTVRMVSEVLPPPPPGFLYLITDAGEYLVTGAGEYLVVPE